jgi:crotonobetainyl-CoA:carnitine CoA-transferase CaiB-like acyl-CoA transferase
MKLLDGIRVLSLNHFLMGPAAAQILADLGADVISVEPPGGAFQRNWAVGNRFVGGDSVNHLSTGRNKRSLAVDLKQAEGLAVVRRLIARSDVFMENYRPGTLEKLGLGAEAVRSLNPRIVYASATGFGSSGPYRDRPGQDLLVQALTGLAAATGEAKGPPTPAGAVVVDHHGAVLYALGILAALLSRARTGKGMTVETSLLGAGFDLQFEALACFLNGGYMEGPRAPGPIATWYASAPYGIYPTADGHIALSMSPLTEVACALRLPDLAGLDDSAAFVRRGEIAGRIADALRSRTTVAWLETLAASPLWHAAVNDYRAAVEDPQVRHLGLVQEFTTAKGATARVLRHPVAYDGELPGVRLPPQPLGAQTREVLAEVGLAPAEIEHLIAAKAVVAAPAGGGA